MKSTQHPHRRAFAALVPATLLLAAPALAQEATQTVTPPPVVPTLPQASALATGPQPLTNGVAARDGIGDPNSATPIAPEAIAQAEEARAARTTPTRATTRATPRRAAPVRQAAPATTSAPAPVAAAPVTTAPAPTAPTATAPATTEAVVPATPPTETAAPVGTAPTETTTDATGTPIWPWIVGALVVLGGLLAFFLRRRNRADEYEEVYEEPVYEEPVVQTAAEPAVIAPVAAPVVSEQRQTQGTRLEPQFLNTAPVAAAAVAGSAADQADAVAVDAELAEPEAEDVAALTAATDHNDRPWLEFAMRPVRAGSNADDALVEIELTVGNSGAIDAEDVRISTFMFADASATPSEMERLLTAHAADSEVAPVTIPAGEGTRVDATLSLPKEHLGDETRAFNPVIVADARYRLADGSEGRTSASFTIGRIADEDEDMPGIAIHRAQMSDDIEARLHGTPAHA